MSSTNWVVCGLDTPKNKDTSSWIFPGSEAGRLQLSVVQQAVCMYWSSTQGTVMYNEWLAIIQPLANSVILSRPISYTSAGCYV